MWLLLALTAIALAAAALILKGALPGGGTSPLSTVSPAGESPLSGAGESPLASGTAGENDDASGSLGPSAAIALLWVAMGVLLALGLSVVIRRFLRPSG